MHHSNLHEGQGRQIVSHPTGEGGEERGTTTTDDGNLSPGLAVHEGVLGEKAEQDGRKRLHHREGGSTHYAGGASREPKRAQNTPQCVYSGVKVVSMGDGTEDRVAECPEA